MLLLLFMVFAVSIVVSFDPNNRYCRIQRCTFATHTMCRYPNDTIHDRCHRLIRAGLRPNEKQTILRVHNYFRRKVYTGSEDRGDPGPQPAAARVSLLEWDNDLAEVAQRWANQCIIMNDLCRNTGKNMDDPLPFRLCIVKIVFNHKALLGSFWWYSEIASLNSYQNPLSIYVAACINFDEDMPPETELRYLLRLVRKWYREVKRFDRSQVERYSAMRAYNTTTFRYTQMVWGNTIKLGCGAIRNHRIRFPVPKIFLICNYGPAGNIEGQPVYETLA